MTSEKDKLRKYNWKTVAHFLKNHTTCTTRDEIKIAKEVYFGEKKPEVMNTNIGMLSVVPTINKEFLECMADNNKRDMEGFRKSIRDGMQRAQNDYVFYFGNNSLFGGNEKLIYDFFQLYESETEMESIRQKQQTDPHPSVSWYVNFDNVFGQYLSRQTIEDHVETWRPFNTWSQALKYAPEKLEIGEPQSSTLRRLLSCEVANNYAENFDKNAVSLCRKIRSVITNENTSGSIRKMYDDLIGLEYERYIQTTGVGGRGTICIQYDTPEQVEAMLKQINSDTRWPGTGNDPGKLDYLLQFEGEERESVGIVNTFWRCGIECDSYDATDDFKIVATFKIGVNHYTALGGISALRHNAIDLESRYTAKKPLRGDKGISESKTFKNAIVIENLLGERIVSNRMFGISIVVNNCDWLDKISERFSSASDFSEELVQEKYQTKLVKELVEARKIRDREGRLF